MIDIPPELPIPEHCPCGSTWLRFVKVSGEEPAVLTCSLNNHRHAYALSDLQMMTLELAVRPDALLGREIWIVGESGPAPIGRMRPKWCTVGKEIKVDTLPHVVVAVEAERVWIQPIMNSGEPHASRLEKSRQPLLDLSELTTAATAFRTAMEQVAPTDDALCHFPTGACGDTSLLLGQWFYAKGWGEWSYVLGHVNDQSHAWIAKDGIYVDITADQFPEMTQAVLVTTDHRWHDALFPDAEEDGPALLGPLEISDDDGDDEEFADPNRLHKVYQRVLEALSPGPEQ